MSTPIHRSRPTAFQIDPAPIDGAAVEVASGIWMSEGLSNTFCMTTDEGRVIVNTGMFFEGPVHKRNFDAVDDGPVPYIVVTQGHVDHVGGVGHIRGPETRLVAQAGNAAHQADDERIFQYRLDKSAFAFGDKVTAAIRATLQEFGSIPPMEAPTPDIVFDDTLTLDVGGRQLELIHVPGGETMESLVVWLPEEKVVLVGNFFSALIGHIPNLVTMRGDRIRDPLVFVESANRIRDLGAELLLPGHHQPVVGADTIRQEIERVRDATLWVHDQTVAAMNAGRSLWETMASVELPPELAVGQGYGKVSWDVRAIWELYTGWFRHESTTELYGRPRPEVDPDLVELAGGPDPVVARAQQRLDDGDPVAAIHLAEVVTATEPGHPGALDVLIAAHQRLVDSEDNFWLVCWLRKQIESYATHRGHR